jgi:hypothetical protein
LIIALACYVGVAIGLPLLNGAGRNRLFVEHAVVVAAASLLVLALAYIAGRRQRLDIKKAGAHPRFAIPDAAR